jgi:hypothetical protein
MCCNFQVISFIVGNYVLGNQQVLRQVKFLESDVHIVGVF